MPAIHSLHTYTLKICSSEVWSLTIVSIYLPFAVGPFGTHCFFVLPPQRILTREIPLISKNITCQDTQHPILGQNHRQWQDCHKSARFGKRHGLRVTSVSGTQKAYISPWHEPIQTQRSMKEGPKATIPKVIFFKRTKRHVLVLASQVA